MLRATRFLDSRSASPLINLSLHCNCRCDEYNINRKIFIEPFSPRLIHLRLILITVFDDRFAR